MLFVVYRVVGSNSIQYKTICMRLIHRKCSGVYGSVCKATNRMSLQPVSAILSKRRLSVKILITDLAKNYFCCMAAWTNDGQDYNEVAGIRLDGCVV